MDSSKKSSHSDRTANFSDAEVQLLLDLVTKYKSVILNKSTNSSINSAKEKVWQWITKKFNKEKVSVHRSTDHLKTKWLNLKRETRKFQVNSPSYVNDVHKQVIQLSYESVNQPSLQIEIPELEFSDGSESEELHNQITPDKFSNEDQGSSSHSDVDDEDPLKKERSRCYKGNGIRKKSINFTVQECRLLLKLVKEEKYNLFMPGLSKEVVKKKSLAWDRVAKRFNAISWKKRPVQVLKTKLENMRRLNRQKISVLTNITPSTEHEERVLFVKKEPSSEYNVESNEMSHSVDGDRHERTSSPMNSDVDPLRFVLNSDSGLGSSSICSQNDTDLMKLRMELINYQMETAKLERQRVEDAMRADKEEQESRAIEGSLRLRTARLNALDAERKFGDRLTYTEQEVLGVEYMKITKNVTE